MLMRTACTILCFPLTAALACSDDDDTPAGPDAGSGGGSSGGASSSGGKTSSGGASTGGAKATGGTPSSGGAKATGGATASGGSGSSGAPGDGGPDGSTPPGDWDGCPTLDDYAGDASWTHPLRVTDEAVFCATFNETRTLKEELAAKALLRVPPGQYKLPAADRQNLGLPLCFKFGKDATPVGVTGGNTVYTTDEFEGTVNHQYVTTQTLTAFGSAHSMETHLIDRAPKGTLPAFVLDGTTPDVFAQDGMYRLHLCPVGEQCYGHHVFDSCTHESSRLHTHVVTFGGGAGSVTFELRIGDSMASTEPGAFVRAHGTFKGTAFDQKDYWKLVYNPAHHHFERNFAVLFDSPIDGACGIQVKGLEPFEQDQDLTPNVAKKVDCALNEGAVVAVQSHVHTAPPFP